MQNKTRSEREIFELLDLNNQKVRQGFSELQQKWYQQIQKEDYHLFLQQIKENERMKQRQLAIMLEYIHTTECRRKFIARYFHNPEPTQEEICCCSDSSFDYETLQQSTLAVQQTLDWQNILLKIFKVESNS